MGKPAINQDFPLETSATTSFDCLTWNVHRGRGNGNGFNPDRVHTAIETEIAARTIRCLALQEADLEVDPQPGFLDISRIERATGLHSVHTSPEMRRHARSSGFFGCVTFVDADFQVTGQTVVDLPGHWHRGAVVVEGRWNTVPVRLVNTHLSRSEVLRMAQMRTLGQAISRREPMQTIVMGDINDWRFWRGPAFHPRLVGTSLEGPRRRTFPMRCPLLALDRIMTDAPGRVEELAVLDGAAITIASDHHPLWGRVMIGAR